MPTPGPLEQEWRLVHEMLRTKERNETEIAAFRMTFYLGARTALDAAARSPMALMHVGSELRAIDKEVMEDLANEIRICPAVNIS
jgi:hypothetical protein